MTEHSRSSMRKVKTMKNMSKALVGTVAAGAMAMASASPAMAQSRYDHRDRDEDAKGQDSGPVMNEMDFEEA